MECFLKDYKITSCFPNGSKFYFVMTKSAPGYDISKRQYYCVKENWSELEDVIKFQYKKGRIITALSYVSKSFNNDTESDSEAEEADEYIVVMTESEQRQYFDWDDSECRPGYTPTVIFQDPLDMTVLYVKTKHVSNIGECIIRSGYDIQC